MLFSREIYKLDQYLATHIFFEKLGLGMQFKQSHFVAPMGPEPYDLDKVTHCIVAALGRRRQVDQEFKVILRYMVSLRPVSLQKLLQNLPGGVQTDQFKFWRWHIVAIHTAFIIRRPRCQHNMAEQFSLEPGSHYLVVRQSQVSRLSLSVFPHL